MVTWSKQIRPSKTWFCIYLYELQSTVWYSGGYLLYFIYPTLLCMISSCFPPSPLLSVLSTPLPPSSYGKSPPALAPASARATNSIPE